MREETAGKKGVIGRGQGGKEGGSDQAYRLEADTNPLD